MEKGVEKPARECSPIVCPHLMDSPTLLRTLYLETEKNNQLEWGEVYNLHIQKASCTTEITIVKLKLLESYFLSYGMDLPA